MTVMPTPNTSACAESMTMDLATPGTMAAGQRHGRGGDAGRIACIAIGLLKPKTPAS